MALNRVDYPTTPNPVSGDWEKLVNIVTKSFQNINDPLQVDGSNIPQGATFQVGGVIYYGDSDTAITGTSSDYVKLTPNSGNGGATLDPSFVADLTGVTWNKVWNGYYDTNGNLYIFDEVKAIIAGDLSGSFSKFSELWNNNFDQRLKTTDSPTFNNLTTARFKLDTDFSLSSNVSSGSNTIFRPGGAMANGDTAYHYGDELLIPFNGIIRVNSTLSRNNTNTTIYGRVFINGSAVGTEHSTTAASYSYSENITVSKYDKLKLGVRESYSSAVSYHKATISIAQSLPILARIWKGLVNEI